MIVIEKECRVIKMELINENSTFWSPEIKTKEEAVLSEYVSLRFLVLSLRIIEGAGGEFINCRITFGDPDWGVIQKKKPCYPP